jgi:exodeoxyribonuclease-3
LLQWLAARNPDVVCLQETKLEDTMFPAAELRDAGYQACFSGQKTYNGVAILARSMPTQVQFGILNYADEQKRAIAASVEGVRIVCAYVPNGQSLDSDKYQYKLNWLRAFSTWLKDELTQHPRLAVLGDYNIAPADEDVHDPKAWEGQVLCSAPEREALTGLLGLGFADGFRLFEQAPRSFTWWDYRMNGFRRDLGLRIDHILLSSPLTELCTAVHIDREVRAQERPSDHAPVVAELASV